MTRCKDVNEAVRLLLLPDRGERVTYRALGGNWVTGRVHCRTADNWGVAVVPEGSEWFIYVKAEAFQLGAARVVPEVAR